MSADFIEPTPDFGSNWGRGGVGRIYQERHTPASQPWQRWLKCQQKHDALNGVAQATLAIGLWLSGAAAAHVASMNTPKLGIAVEQ